MSSGSPDLQRYAEAKHVFLDFSQIPPVQLGALLREIMDALDSEPLKGHSFSIDSYWMHNIPQGNTEMDAEFGAENAARFRREYVPAFLHGMNLWVESNHAGQLIRLLSSRDEKLQVRETMLVEK